MKITFLGTSSMVPTSERGQTGIFLECGREKILVDCGENVQRQMRIAKIAPPRITKIFISHWHGDHMFGLPGLLENLAKNAFMKSINIYGPKEIGIKIKKVMDAFGITGKIKVVFKGIEKNGVFDENDELEFGAHFLKHSAKTLGYYIKEKDRTCLDKEKIKKYGLPSGPILGKLQKGIDVEYKGKKIKSKDVTYVKKGKKIGIVIDTLVCNGAVELGNGADVLVCEATYLNDLKDKAKDHYHLTSGQAGEIAKKAGTKRLILTHFSQRYKKADMIKMKKEAEEEFKGPVVVAKDFMSVSF